VKAIRPRRQTVKNIKLRKSQLKWLFDINSRTIFIYFIKKKRNFLTFRKHSRYFAVESMKNCCRQHESYQAEESIISAQTPIIKDSLLRIRI
jgi:hypothetical protein